MQTDSSRGTFEEVMGNTTPEVAAIADRLRALIISVYPEVTEVPRPAEQHVDYGIGLNRAQIFGYLCPMKDYVRLGFYYGGMLPDPRKRLVGEGKRLRHVKIYSLGEADRPEIRRLVVAAIQERKKTLQRK